MRKKSLSIAAPDWAKLLEDAVHSPGVLSAYRQFWNYSVGNQLMAMFECMSRGIQPGPIHTFKGWHNLGRHIKKGQKAITLCMPVSVKRKPRQDKQPLQPQQKSADDTEDSTGTITVFTFKPRWFVLSQTDGKAYVPTELPDWSESRALGNLKIERIEFTHTNGNCQGFATGQQVAVSPIAALPHKTLFHELAHVVLGHTVEGLMDDHDRTPVSLREVEAECVAMICCESLGLPGVPDCRGYIQHWLDGQSIPDRSAQRIFRTANAILKSGYSVPVDEDADL